MGLKIFKYRWVGRSNLSAIDGFPIENIVCVPDV